ncbi:ankyrin [Dendrothele bispora CBS 962.96]|uniref:Ankyrin n=1 Tax=Dendrothele bispora (strain CBS 962.96) TaxID=1314807 RepID=A0A4S8MUE3_DENBC|nr:ankyrin [Dendrothele bispora CBS 962.96]
MAVPTVDEKDDVFLSCRYGDLEDIETFVKSFGPEPLPEIRDENSNTVLHMICGNGHKDVLDYVLPLVSPSLLSVQNDSGSTPLHWAALNSHLDIVKTLVQFPSGPGIDLIDIKNAAGRSPLAEAELSGWEEGAKWLVEVMNLDTEKNIKEENGADVDDSDVVDPKQDIEVEIEDADGQVAKMTISGGDTSIGRGPQKEGTAT